MMDSVIELKNVSKRFEITHQKRDTVKENFIGFIKGDNTHTESLWALKDINLDIKSGQCVGIVGENGSGKTTLLKLMGRILEPTTGEISINGKVAPLLSLGVGFESDLTAKENVYLYGSIMGLTEKQIDERYDDIVEFSELGRFMDAQLKTFSSGMKIRLGFATAINIDCDILLVDEVLSVGDGAFQKKCLEEFDKFKRRGKTIVYVSHGMGTIKKYCDKVLFLHEGKVRIFGDTLDVIPLYKKHLLSKELRVNNSHILDSINNRYMDIGLPYIEDLKIYNHEEEEAYVLDSGKKCHILVKVRNVPENQILVADLSGQNDGVYLFSKNYVGDFLCFKVDSLPLTCGEYKLSIKTVDGDLLTGYEKFDISVNIGPNAKGIRRIFIENPVTLDKEVLSFGKESENVFKDFNDGHTLICFDDLDVAIEGCEEGSLFFYKELLLNGSPEKIIGEYNKRVYKSAISILARA